MTIGKRIKQARLTASLSLRQLADEVGVSAMAISKYERDLAVPSSGVLLRLARALGVKTEYFFRSASVALTAPAYRKKAAMPKKHERAVTGQIQNWLERYLEVESFFSTDERAMRFSIPTQLDFPIRTPDDIEHAAEELRKAWKLGFDPIENLTEVLENKGIKVGMVDGNDRVDAATFWANDATPVIVIKRNLPGDRQRFNLAHELGHLVLKVKPPLKEEAAAHRFAGAFLVPAAMARRELGEKRQTLGLYELHMLKHLYGLSMQAWIHRAKELDILSPSSADKMFRWFRAHDYHRQEPGDQIPPEVPTRFERLVMQLLEEEMISETRAAELLGKPLSQFSREVSRQHDGLLALVRD
jgi:Zn-dependent peptidase ImmA (M78 family)/DNA-binding XRE family transcriptional regulator